MEFEARAELVAVDDMKGGLVEHDAVLEERRIDGGKETRGGAVKDTRSLYEQIAAARQAAEDLKKQGDSQAFKPRGLDEEEAEFLAQQLDTEYRKASAVASQEAIDKRAFELALSTRLATPAAPASTTTPLINLIKPGTAVFRAKAKTEAAAPLSGAKRAREAGVVSLNDAVVEKPIGLKDDPLITPKDATEGDRGTTLSLDMPQSPITGTPPAPGSNTTLQRAHASSQPKVIATNSGPNSSRTAVSAPVSLVDYYSSSDDEDDE